MSTVDDVVRALGMGQPVVIPTDTVYGLACRPDREDAVRLLSALKGRAPEQPIALVGASIEALRRLVPELPERGVLTGAYTFVVPNPERRLAWLSGSQPDAIGVRIPDVVGPAAELLGRVGVVAATSANLHGDEDPARAEDVPAAIVAAVAAVLDGGELPGSPSTVVDLTGSEPRVLREGAVPGDEALARIARSRAQ
jgi:L-threonylcarbamoyladenylate synthase